MYDATRGLVRLRSAAVWSVVTLAAAGTAWSAAPVLAAAPAVLRAGAGFAELLVAGCALASAVAAGWLWAITTAVVAGVLCDGGRAPVRRLGPVRLLLLSACGAVVLSATATPASADESRPIAPHSLGGLPLPDRATSDAAPPPDHTGRSTSTTVIVRPGDSLWAIAERRLGPRATVADVVDYWHRIHDRNAEQIGPDPDLILPGQELELPPTD